MAENILVYSDNVNIAEEMLGKGREIAEKTGGEVIAVIIGDGNPELESEFIHFGADKVFVAEADIKDFSPDIYSGALATAIKETNASIILIGANRNGKELGPRLAAKLDAGCVSEINDMYIDGENLIAERIMYSGNAIVKEQFTSSPKIVIVPGRTFQKIDKDTSRIGEIVKQHVDLKPSPVKIVNVQQRELEGVKLEDAEIIISCGRGLKNKEDLQLLKELADVLKAEIGCSRPISADLNWLSKDHWVGLSGVKVKPKLYIACGISGAIQHLAGMRDSGIIIAVNKDKDAPIFNAADYGIVGDLYQVLPILTKVFKEKSCV